MPTTQKHYPTQTSTEKLTGSTLSETTNPETSGGLPAKKTAGIFEQLFGRLSKERKSHRKNSLNDTCISFFRRLLLGLLNAASPERRFLNGNPDALVPVYDIVNAGKQHRFATANFIAHNCLGMGYGTGAEKFRTVAKIMAGLDISLQEAQETVQAYRDSNPKIVALWRKMDRELRVATDPRDGTLEIALPSGRCLVYRNVRRVTGNIVAKLPRNGKMMDVKLYGSLVVENLTQALARDVFMDRCVALEDAGYEILLRVHDEVVLLVDEDGAEEKLKEVEKIMSTPPSWCADLPLGAEAIISKFYRK